MDEFSNKQKLAFLILILAVLVVFTLLIQKYLRQDNSRKVDYSNDSGSTLVANSDLLEDRAIFWQLNEIINSYFNSYSEYNDLGEKKKDYFSYKNYYDILTDDYKSKLSKSGYIEVANKFFAKFMPDALDDGDPVISEVNVLGRAYKFDTNKYICLIQTGHELAYIGIELVPSTKNWYIFYLE